MMQLDTRGRSVPRGLLVLKSSWRSAPELLWRYLLPIGGSQRLRTIFRGANRFPDVTDLSAPRLRIRFDDCILANGFPTNFESQVPPIRSNTRIGNAKDRRTNACMGAEHWGPGRFVLMIEKALARTPSGPGRRGRRGVRMIPRGYCPRIFAHGGLPAAIFSRRVVC
jgi:hypothetical protein